MNPSLTILPFSYFQIIANKERYVGDENDHDALPAIFWWFPKQEDFIPPPPTHETCLEKMDRISSTIKVSLLQVTAFSPYDQLKADMQIAVKTVWHTRYLV